jgi:hypothetical protein
MKYAILAVNLVAAVVLTSAQAACAAEGSRFTLETGGHYSTGKYGGTQSTEIVYIPVTGKYRSGPWTVKVTVPYLQITGPANVINGVGQTVATTGTARTTRSGLGDVVASVSNMVYYDAPAGLFAKLTGKVKLGTASSAQGLGTGKNDYAIQSELYQVKENLTTFGTLGYQIYGRPAGYRLNNAFYGSLGGSYKFDQQTSGGVLLSLGQKITTTGATRAKALLFASRKLDQSWKMQGYVLRGFTRSVPDWGAGVTVSCLL